MIPTKGSILELLSGECLRADFVFNIIFPEENENKGMAS